MKICVDWKEFSPLLDQKMVILSPFCGSPNCETLIKDQSTREEPTDQVNYLLLLLISNTHIIDISAWDLANGSKIAMYSTWPAQRCNTSGTLYSSWVHQKGTIFCSIWTKLLIHIMILYYVGMGSLVSRSSLFFSWISC